MKIWNGIEDLPEGHGPVVASIGNYDGVLLLNAPNDETAAAATLSLGRGGFVQTQTLRAFDKETIQGILSKL